MTVVITIIIIIITLAYIIYPFFSKVSVSTAEIPNKPPDKSTERQAQIADRKMGDINAEIERRVSDIRKKDKAVCPDCGASYREGSRFCSQCGADLSVNK